MSEGGGYLFYNKHIIQGLQISIIYTFVYLINYISTETPTTSRIIPSGTNKITTEVSKQLLY